MQSPIVHLAYNKVGVVSHQSFSSNHCCFVAAVINEATLIAGSLNTLQLSLGAHQMLDSKKCSCIQVS
jgi:hypothetical protein